MSCIANLIVSADSGCWNGTGFTTSLRSGPGPVERRSMNGQPATHSTPSPAATEQAVSFTPASRAPVTASYRVTVPSKIVFPSPAT